MVDLYKMQSEIDDKMRALLDNVLLTMPKTLKAVVEYDDTLRTLIYMSIAINVSKAFIKILSEKK